MANGLAAFHPNTTITVCLQPSGLRAVSAELYGDWAVHPAQSSVNPPGTYSVTYVPRGRWVVRGLSLEHCRNLAVRLDDEVDGTWDGSKEAVDQVVNGYFEELLPESVKAEQQPEQTGA